MYHPNYVPFSQDFRATRRIGQRDAGSFSCLHQHVWNQQIGNRRVRYYITLYDPLFCYFIRENYLDQFGRLGRYLDVTTRICQTDLVRILVLSVCTCSSPGGGSLL